jgi:hypothetical protein
MDSKHLVNVFPEFNVGMTTLVSIIENLLAFLKIYKHNLKEK